jgi:hypothetical protein
MIEIFQPFGVGQKYRSIGLLLLPALLPLAVLAVLVTLAAPAAFPAPRRDGGAVRFNGGRFAVACRACAPFVFVCFVFIDFALARFAAPRFDPP